MSTVDTAVPHSQDAGHSSCGAIRSNAKNRVTVPEAGSVKVRDGPSPLEAMEAGGGLGAGLLSLRGMTSLRPQGISQLNQDPIPENMKAHSHSNKETRKIPQTTTIEDTNDLPASPQLNIDFSNNPFYNDNVLNLFTKLDLETSTASSNLEGIMNTCNFLSEEPQQTLLYNISSPI